MISKLGVLIECVVRWVVSVTKKRITHYDMLNNNETLPADNYCHQLRYIGLKLKDLTNL